MNTPSGRFRPVEYPGEFIRRVRLEYADDTFILDLLDRKSYSLGAYLDDRSTASSPTRQQLYKDWRVIVDSRTPN
jgi:hypothetical protein